MGKMMKIIYNLRPYSWIDLTVLGLLAKFSLDATMNFTVKDIFMILGLILLWFFFNLTLELKHGYNYRSKPSILSGIISLLIAVSVGVYFEISTLIFVAISTFLVIVYLLKNKNRLFGNSSAQIRGLIQTSYFFYALMFYTTKIGLTQIIIGIIVILITFARSIVGDLRDIEHNQLANKKTFAVSFGKNISIIAIETAIIIATLLIAYFFNFLIAIPLILFAITILFFKNGFVLHQLTIMTTMFVSVNFISYFTDINLFFMNLIFAGILLNMVFYPLLKRKSNPIFKNNKGD
jgi:4-hydroxybenzoate polyprenyltransferase